MGPGTEAALRRRGLAPDLLPPRYVAEGVIEALGSPEVGGDDTHAVWILRAEVGRDVLPIGLAAAGWHVHDIATHQTVPVTVSAEQLLDVASSDIVAFASSSAVSSFVATVPGHHWPLAAAAIGPITAATARDAGFAIVVEADEHTVPQLVRVIEQWAAADVTPRQTLEPPSAG